MKKCPKCGELNGDNNNKCYKCGADITNIRTTPRYCSSCQQVFAPNVDVCPNCKTETSEYNPAVAKYISKTASVDTWMYVVGFLIPLVGIILGCIQFGKNDRAGGRNLIITAIVSTVLYTIISVVFHPYFLIR